MTLCACGCGKQHHGGGDHWDGHDGPHGGVLLGPDESVVKVVVPMLGAEPDDDDDYDDYDDDDDGLGVDLGDLLPMLDGDDDAVDAVDLPHARKVDRSNVEGWPVPEDRDGSRTMIALRVPPKVGGRYGRDAEHIVDLEPLQNRHITLLHLGRKSPEERSRLHEVLRRWMSQGQWQPLEGQAQGWGTFTKPGGGGRNVLWMGWNIPGLAELRHDLKGHLAGAGFDCSSGYDFIPHETVGYSDEIPGVLPMYPEQPVEHTFDGLLIGEDDEWTEYPFHTGLVLASGRPAVVAALEAAVDDEVAAMSDMELDALIAGGGADRNRGQAEKLRRYWTVGRGGLKIRWGTKGDWTRCVKYLSKHMGPRAKGYCTLRHKEMTGLHTGSMAHRIKFGWGGKPGSYWAKVAAENSINASAGLSMVFGMHGDRVVVPMSGDPADPLVRLLGGEPLKQVEFRIPLLLPEGVESGDGRTFEKGVVDVRETPIPLLWQPNSMQGHDGAVIVGRIDRVERTDDGIGNCHGVFDTSPMAMEAVRMIRDGFLRGVSADLDKFEAKILGKGTGVAVAGKKSAKDDDVVAPDKMSIKSGRIMAATLVAKPAFEQAKIELLEGGGPVESQVDVEGAVEPVVASADQMIPDGVYRGALGDDLRAGAARFVGRLRKEGYDRSVAQFSSLVASGVEGAISVPAKPPASWFENPDLPKPTHLTIDDEGRVFGHIAAWHVDHIGMGFGTRPPKSKSNYAYFRTGLLRTAEGNDLRVGQLTLAGGHATLQADAQAAVKHYDDTNSAFADVVAGEDRHGIWVSGALRPGVTEAQLRVARASSPSGDWRPINGRLELVAVCQVNVPGFPVVEARVASGAVVALVAAGTSPLVASMVDDGSVTQDTVGTVVTEFAGDSVLSPEDLAVGKGVSAEELASDEFVPMPDLADDVDDTDVYASIVDGPSLTVAVGEFVCGMGGERTKRGIVFRANELGIGDLLPQSWSDDVFVQPRVAAVESARAAVGAAEASALEAAFLSAKVRMLRSRVGEPAAGFVASVDEGPDEKVELDEAVRGLTIREAAALLFAAQREAEELEAAEGAALTAAVEAGEALGDGSWWIRDDADVRSAVESFGALQGTRERRVVQNHIKRRARELGATEFVPNWWWSPRESAAFNGEGVSADVAEALEAAIEAALEAEFAKFAEEGATDVFNVEEVRAQLAADFGVVMDDDEMMMDDPMMDDPMMMEDVVDVEVVDGVEDEEMGMKVPDESDVEEVADELGGDMEDAETEKDMEDDDMFAADGVTAAAGELADASPAGAVLSKQPVSAKRRQTMAAKGTAMPGGKFPIADVADLKRAIKAYGRAKDSDRAAVRRHIIKRARALGKMDLIPESWPKR